MKIAYLVPGSGGTFYCQNCLRDGALIKALRRRGHDVVLMPLYLPLSLTPDMPDTDAPVFYGAINCYLEEKVPVFRHTPRWIDRFFERPALLRMAARMSGSTSADGLEDLTLSMLLGAQGHQAKELERLLDWLKAEGAWDAIHLSNALLLGLAGPLREATGAPVYCSLQDEHVWLEAMRPAWAERVRNAMRERADAVSLFLPVSRWYARRMHDLAGLPEERMRVIPLGIEVGDDTPVIPARADGPPVIGFLSRLSKGLGLGLLFDAFLALKKEPRFRDLRLRATGGMVGDDRSYVDDLKRRADHAGCGRDVAFVTDFDEAHRRQFMKDLTLVSVPVPGGEAFGLFMLEAMDAGVPVVLPAEGAFPEIVEDTGGGLVYAPNDAATLARTLAGALEDRARLSALGGQGRAAVRTRYTIDRMAAAIENVYRGA